MGFILVHIVGAVFEKAWMQCNTSCGGRGNLGNARKKSIFLLWGLPLKQGDSETNNESIDNACQKQDRALSKATNPTHCFHRTSYNSSPWRTLVGAIGFYNWFHVNNKLPFLLKILFSWSQCLMHRRHLAEGFQTAPYLSLSCNMVCNRASYSNALLALSQCA